MASDLESYPTRQDLVRAGLLAVSTGVLGFVFSYSLFVGPIKPARAQEKLDRGSAERPQPAAYREHRPGSYFHFGFSAGSADSGPEVRGASKLRIEKPARELPKVAAAPAARAPQPEATSRPLPQEPEMRPLSRIQIKAPQQAAPPPVPVQAVRPDEVSWPEAWQRFSLSWVSCGDFLRIGGEGVVVGPGQVLTTLSCFQQSGGRVLLGGQAASGRLEACDPTLDLALVQLPPGVDAPVVPLSPEDPTAGQLLICAPSQGGSFQEVRSRGGVGGGLSGFYGSTAGGLGGGSLVNQRGELVALALPRPRWGSLSWCLAVPASRLRQFLEARPRPAGQPPRPFAELWTQALAGRVAPLAARNAPSRSNARVVAGESLGNYPLGITLTQLRQELGAPEVLEQQGGFQRVRFSGPRLTFTLVQEVAVAIETDYGFYALESGWSAGYRLEPKEGRQKMADSLLCERPGSATLCTPGLEVQIQDGSLSWIRVVVR